jgi:hypothetical protein
MSDMAEQRARVRFANGVASTITFVAGLIAIVLAVHVAFVVFDANPQNGIVKFFSRFATDLALGFKDLFTPDSMKRRVAVNFGAAAVFYLIAGHLVARLIRRAS